MNANKKINFSESQSVSRAIIEANYTFFYVYGQSMFPTLRHGDKVLIKKAPPSEIKTKDIIVYNANNCVVSHRVIKIVNTSSALVFYTRGDFNRSIETIPDNRLVGKVIGVFRKEKLKFITFEHSLVYYIFINIISLFKDLLIKMIEAVYSFASVRKIMKLLFPLKINYFPIKDVQQSDDFRSFYNFYPFLVNEYCIHLGLIAKYRNNPVGKLWILEDKKGDYFLYGPYIKILYRGRGIGAALTEKAVQLIDRKKEHIYFVLSFKDRRLIEFFKVLGFKKYLLNGSLISL